MKKGDHLFLVDGSAYIFRAYHALPPLTRKSDGLPVGAVAGYCNMIWKLVQDARDTSVGIVPTHFAVIFDYSSKTFRNEIYPEYKANREAPPEDLRPQFGLIRQATRAFNLPCIEAKGFEADDLIATYARHARELGADVTIISSDKDLMQLVDDNVVMYDQMKDRRVGPDEVMEKFGVSPDMMIDLQALAGDSTDNIPGVPGIGPKTAALLLNEYGDLDSLLERAAEIKQNKRRENLIEFAELARLSKQLVTLKDDVELEVPLADFLLQPADGPKLISFLKAMEFKSITRKVAGDTVTDADSIEPEIVEVDGYSSARGPDLDAVDSEKIYEGGRTPDQFAEQMQTESASSSIDRSLYQCVRSENELLEWVERITQAGIVAVDTETNSLDPMQAELVGISLATEPGVACYIPITHKSGHGDLLGGGFVDDQLSLDKVLEGLRAVFE
ncbi:MAG: DNA polymerase I, partial [Hyphomicrobiales bacterium]|nr:DNA polymerase I [Hyphomicrobiales bacterium]